MDNMLAKLKHNPYGYQDKIVEKTDKFPIPLIGEAKSITKTGVSYRYATTTGNIEISIKSEAELVDGRQQILEVVYHFGHFPFSSSSRKETRIDDIFSTTVEKDGSFITKVYDSLKSLKQKTPYKVYDGQLTRKRNEILEKDWTELNTELPGQTITRHYKQTPVEKSSTAINWRPKFNDNLTIMGKQPYTANGKIFGGYSDSIFGPMYRTELWEEVEDSEGKIEKYHHVMYGSKKYPASYYHELHSKEGTVIFINESELGWEKINPKTKEIEMHFAQDAMFDVRHEKEPDMKAYDKKTEYDDYYSKPPEKETTLARKIYDTRKIDPENLKTFNIGIKPEVSGFNFKQDKEK